MNTNRHESEGLATGWAGFSRVHCLVNPFLPVKALIQAVLIGVGSYYYS